MLPQRIHGATISIAPSKGLAEASGKAPPRLHVRKRGGWLETAWEPTPSELAAINAGAPVLVRTLGIQPPMFVEVDNSVVRGVSLNVCVEILCDLAADVLRRCGIEVGSAMVYGYRAAVAGPGVVYVSIEGRVEGSVAKIESECPCIGSLETVSNAIASDLRFQMGLMPTWTAVVGQMTCNAVQGDCPLDLLALTKPVLPKPEDQAAIEPPADAGPKPKRARRKKGETP